MDPLISRKLFDRTCSFIQRSLDLRTSRQKVLSSNVANSETPNYLSKDLPFQKVLENSMEPSLIIGLKRTHPQHLPEDLTSEVKVESTMEGVNIDLEMAKLSENNLMFQAGVQSLIKKFEALKFTILDIGR